MPLVASSSPLLALLHIQLATVSLSFPLCLRLTAPFCAVRCLGGNRRFFQEGWGDLGRHIDFLDVVSNTFHEQNPIDIQWRRLTSHLCLGRFLSPGASYLARESAFARVLYARPRGRVKGTVLLLPATGEHGFVRRFALFSGALLREASPRLFSKAPCTAPESRTPSQVPCFELSPHWLISGERR